jgi:CheY-like chemotaxis protein
MKHKKKWLKSYLWMIIQLLGKLIRHLIAVADFALLFRVVISHLLQSEGITCETAASGQEAIAKIFSGTDSAKASPKVPHLSLDSPVPQPTKTTIPTSPPSPQPNSPPSVTNSGNFHLVLMDIHMPVS